MIRVNDRVVYNRKKPPGSAPPRHGDTGTVQAIVALLAHVLWGAYGTVIPVPLDDLTREPMDAAGR